MRRLAIAAALVIAVVGGVYVWALLSTDRSTLARALVWREADIGDQARFPARTIRAGTVASPLPVAATPDRAIDDALRGTDTRAFVVVRDDRIVYERDAGERTRETSFSVAKSFVSTLVGLAIAQGKIGSVDDPLTRYVPELARRDPRFARITLRDLLTMRSGLRYRESDLPWPWGDDTDTYYGVDLRAVALSAKIEEPPGRHWHYNNYNPLLLGLVLERATEQSVSAFMSAALWRPLGAAADATWSLDSDRSGFEKLESGLNAIARDYARFGLLFLHDGRDVVPRAWVREATRAQTPTDYANPYGYFWWVDGRRPDRFYALGNYGQYVYVDPVARVVIVRLGSDWGYENERWLALFRSIADRSSASAQAAASPSHRSRQRLVAVG